MEDFLMLGFPVECSGELINQNSKGVLQKRDKGIPASLCLPGVILWREGMDFINTVNVMAGRKQALKGSGVGWGRVRGKERWGFFLFVFWLFFLKQLLEGRGNGWMSTKFRLFFYEMHWQMPRTILHGYIVRQRQASRQPGFIQDMWTYSAICIGTRKWRI